MKRGCPPGAERPEQPRLAWPGRTPPCQTRAQDLAPSAAPSLGVSLLAPDPRPRGETLVVILMHSCRGGLPSRPCGSGSTACGPHWRLTPAAQLVLRKKGSILPQGKPGSSERAPTRSRQPDGEEKRLLTLQTPDPSSWCPRGMQAVLRAGRAQRTSATPGGPWERSAHPHGRWPRAVACVILRLWDALACGTRVPRAALRPGTCEQR